MVNLLGYLQDNILALTHFLYPQQQRMEIILEAMLRMISNAIGLVTSRLTFELLYARKRRRAKRFTGVESSEEEPRKSLCCSVLTLVL